MENRHSHSSVLKLKGIQKRKANFLNPSEISAAVCEQHFDKGYIPNWHTHSGLAGSEASRVPSWAGGASSSSESSSSTMEGCVGKATAGATATGAGAAGGLLLLLALLAGTGAAARSFSCAASTSSSCHNQHSHVYTAPRIVN